MCRVWLHALLFHVGAPLGVVRLRVSDGGWLIDMFGLPWSPWPDVLFLPFPSRLLRCFSAGCNYPGTSAALEGCCNGESAAAVSMLFDRWLVL